MGRYCFHFHLKKKCTSCTLVGNAVVNSVQGAIVVHGTHQSEVKKNILWDSVSVGLYTEDGNEMNNTFSENVMICSGKRSKLTSNPTKSLLSCEFKISTNVNGQVMNGKENLV